MQALAHRPVRRWRRAPVLLALLVARLAQAGGEFVPTADMPAPRALYGVAPLQDGRAVFVGGIADFGMILAEVEAYDPASDAFGSVGFALVARMRPSVVALQDGRV
ncbi:MAG TPA: kelch repeat-containing protein, partial [Dokdonella sp.]